MKDAELIGLAALVQASCTEIEAANQMRHVQEATPAYAGFEDVFGDRAAHQIEEELARRQRIRDIEREFELPGDTCSAIDVTIGRHCMLGDKHGVDHAVVFEQYGEKIIMEWPHKEDEPKPVAPGDEIPF